MILHMVVRSITIRILDTITWYLSVDDRPILLPASYSLGSYARLLPASYSLGTYARTRRDNIRLFVLLFLSFPFRQTGGHGLPTHSCDAPAVLSLTVALTFSLFLLVSFSQERHVVRKISCHLSFSIQLCQLILLYLGHPLLAVVGGEFSGVRPCCCNPWGRSLNVP